MFKTSLSNNLKPARLRTLMWLFFLAMAAPTAVLIYKSYDQLKWEAFYQHRQLADELTRRVDQAFVEFVEQEESRSFSDYGFIMVGGNATTNYVERSPLSEFLAIEQTPGVIGYFQIDVDGQLSSPLLPSTPEITARYGLSESELATRRSAVRSIEDILKSNQLVTKRTFTDPETEQDGAAESGAAPVSRAPGRAASSSISLNDLDLSNLDLNDLDSNDLNSDDASSVSAAEIQSSLESTNLESNKFENLNQAGFDKLSKNKTTKSSEAISSERKDTVLGRLKELELEAPYQQKIDQLQNKKETKSQAQDETSFSDLSSLNTPKIRARKVSKERSLAAELTKADDGELLLAQAIEEDSRQIGIQIFESEVDPFEVSLLESGHFVLYRKVWRDGQRYIQGILLEQTAFIDALARSHFESSLLSQMSTLTLIYQGNLLLSLDKSRGSYSRAGGDFDGTLLSRTRLSEPFNQLESIFTIRNLPAGPGERVILWAALILAAVLSIGVMLLYRLSLRNLRLVNQQQDFVSAVSHELKTPLTSIRMYGEILQEGWASDDKKKTYYSYIFDESERLTRLINNVLELARMTRNETHVELKSISVAELADVIRSKVDSQIERSGFLLNLKVSDTAAPIKLNVDLDVFTQVIINLVDNAIKFSGNAENKTVDISAQLLSNGKLCFSVRDYGPGIAKDQLKKIFELFYRSENELTRETTGTGIGLALVLQLTQLMQGEIDVLNKDVGAEFQLLFSPVK